MLQYFKFIVNDACHGILWVILLAFAYSVKRQICKSFENDFMGVEPRF